MVFESIAGTIIALAIIFIIFKITKKILWTIIIVIILTTIFSGIFGFSLYSDFQDLKYGLESEEKKILLVDESNILTGLIVTDIGFKDELKAISKEQLDLYSEYYKNKEYDKILGDSFKLIIIKISVIAENLKEPPFENQESNLKLTKTQVLDLLRSDQKLQEFHEKNKIDGIEDKYELRAFIFLISMASIAEEKTPAFLLKEYKENRVIIHPDSIILKLVKKIPTKITGNII